MNEGEGAATLEEEVVGRVVHSPSRLSDSRTDEAPFTQTVCCLSALGIEGAKTISVAVIFNPLDLIENRGFVSIRV